MVEISRLKVKRRFVMPAKAGIHLRLCCEAKKTWIPACAGMTKERVDFESTNSEPFGLKPRVIQFFRLGVLSVSAVNIPSRIPLDSIQRQLQHTFS
jgi:hypothetical protein